MIFGKKKLEKNCNTNFLNEGAGGGPGSKAVWRPKIHPNIRRQLSKAPVQSETPELFTQPCATSAGNFLDAIPMSVGESVMDSFRCDAIASPSFASLFCFHSTVAQQSLFATN